MVYKWDSFLKPLAEGDTVIKILDNNGLVKYSIDPFSIINTFINNNIVKINIKDEVILINFSTANEAKIALPILQNQIDELKIKVPNFIDKKIENYILDQIIITQSSTFSALNINSHLIPATGSTYDLGATAGYNWRDLYLSGDTIYLGDTTIKSEQNTIIIDNLLIGGPTSQGGVLLSTSGDSILINGNPIEVGSQSTVLPYIELTNKAFIFEPFVGEVVSFTKTDYGDEVDEIDTNIAITRGDNQGIYNPHLEVEWDNTEGDGRNSPEGTLWNSDGWSDLKNLPSRTFTNFYEALSFRIGDNIIGQELIMHDIINNKYYAFKFNSWTSGYNGGGFSYTRQLLNTSDLFIKQDYGNEIDIISDGLHITRGNRGWLYNTLLDGGHDDGTPTNSLWNNEGWDYLNDIEERIYRSISDIWNGNFENISGSEMIMLDTSTNKYWAIKFLSWTPGQNGGGFSYLRYEIDINQINEGIKFSDGTILKSAEGLGKVKSNSPGGRRIEEITGYSEVNITEAMIIENNVEAIVYQNNNGFDFYVVDTLELIELSNNRDFWTRIEFSFDNGDTWREVELSDGFTGVWRQIYFPNREDHVTVTIGQTLLYRVTRGGNPVRWFRAEGQNVRGAIIDYHAYSRESGTIIGTIHISRDNGNNGNNTITHTESKSGSSNLDQVDIWYRTGSERDIWFRRLDGIEDTLKVQWVAKIFYGNEYYD